VASFKLMPDKASVLQCEATIYQYVDAGGFIPSRFINSLMPTFLLGVMKPPMDAYARDDEIDKVEQDELVRIITDEQQVYTAEEDTLIKKVHDELGSLEWKDFEKLYSPDYLVEMGKIFIDGGGGVVGRASVTVDASAEHCVAWEVAMMTRAQVKADESLGRSLTRINDHHSVFHLIKDVKIPGFSPREFTGSKIWKRQGDKLVVVFDGVDDPAFPPNPLYVRGTSTVYVEYEELPPIGELPQTRVTYTMKVDLGGLIPKAVVNSRAVDQLMYLNAMRKRCDKSPEIDAGARARSVQMIANHEDEYSVEEHRILAEGEQQFADFQRTKPKQIKMVSPLTKAEIVMSKSGETQAWGRAITTVLASPEEVRAPHHFFCCASEANGASVA